ncbi:DUF1521 domain-containing protein [Paraburkholderia agricolaris]|uniref:DUF1521 domain-containing protein n=1 Tax=Paraburkholderia agricolaris TaxID=2152888 RepID=UPI00142EC7A4|nr:DUF1521 domain-containing protein [Paraburkholderia agricolaris]
MQAAMQINASFNPHVANAAATTRNAHWQQPAATPFNNGRNALGQMSNMASGFSKASFSVYGQSTGNGQTSSFYAQAHFSNPGRSANQQPASRGGYNNQPVNRYDTGSRGNTSAPPRNNCPDRTPPRNDCGCPSKGRTEQTQWTATPVTNNKASIDLGNYKLDFNKSDSSMTMTSKSSGDTTKVWGDPHLTQHANGANSSTAMFNGPMTFQLPDNTKVTVGTQADKNNKSVSYADSVTITHGNNAYQVTGLSQQNSTSLSVQKSHDGRALDAATPDGYTLVANRNGSGFVDPKTGKQPTEDEIRKANT